MNLTEIIEKVYLETNRPDLEAETLSSIQASTLKMHTIDYFFRDMVSAQVIFDTAAYIQTLDEITLPRYRSLAYFRKYDPSQQQYQLNPTILPPLFNQYGAVNPQQSLALMKVISPDALFDDYGTERMDVCYQLGNTLFFKSSSAFQYGLVGYYKFPNIHPDMYNSWIADKYPYAIIYDAASSVLQKIGMTDAARKYDSPNGGLVTDQMNILKMSNITPEGY